jgi:hypothetical protein
MTNLQAIERAILDGKTSIKLEGQKISLPEGQKCGTESQRVGYANVTAQTICKQNNFPY